MFSNDPVYLFTTQRLTIKRVRWLEWVKKLKHYHIFAKNNFLKQQILTMGNIPLDEIFWFNGALIRICATIELRCMNEDVASLCRSMKGVSQHFCTTWTMFMSFCEDCSTVAHADHTLLPRSLTSKSGKSSKPGDKSNHRGGGDGRLGAENLKLVRSGMKLICT